MAKRLPDTIWVRWEGADDSTCLLAEENESDLVLDDPVTIGKYTFCEARSVYRTTGLERKPAPKGELPLPTKRKRAKS